MSNEVRARKLANAIKIIVAEVLEKKLRDPRLGFTTITDVRVTNDLQQATIFYTILGDMEDRGSSSLALQSATGTIRSEIGRNLNLRLVPHIKFVADAIPENAEHISELLDLAKSLDESVAKQRSKAKYAGDSDPYKNTSGSENLG